MLFRCRARKKKGKENYKKNKEDIKKRSRIYRKKNRKEINKKIREESKAKWVNDPEFRARRLKIMNKYQAKLRKLKKEKVESTE